MTAITLPGDIPGLLRRGSPVDALGNPAVVLGPDDRPEPERYGEWLVMPVSGEWVANAIRYDDVDWAARSVRSDEMALDLTDPTGRAHAAWWLAGKQAGRDCVAMWDGSPDGSADQRYGIWRLRYRSLTWPLMRSCVGQHPYLAREVESLADLNPDDPRTLPDGSRWVDAEALRRVVLHLAGRQP